MGSRWAMGRTQSSAETGTDHLSTDPQKRVRRRFVILHSRLSGNVYPFLRTHAQKWVRQSLRRPRCFKLSQKRVRLLERRRPPLAQAARVTEGVHAHGVSGMMRIPRALALGWRVFHHSIRMNRISTVPPAGAGILLRVASPHGGRASGERGAGQRQPAMTLHNKRRQPE